MWIDALLPFAPAVSAVAATISATAAYGAVRMNRTNQKTQRLAEIYKRLVADQVHTYLEGFRSGTLVPIEGGISRLCELAASGAHQDHITDAENELIENHKKMERRLSAALMAGAESFSISLPKERGAPEQPLDTALEISRNRTTDVISGIVVKATRTRTGARPSPLTAAELEHCIHDHLVMITRHMLDYDPTRRVPKRALIRRLLPWGRRPAGLAPATSPTAMLAKPDGRTRDNR
jgi:hypothetical protein